MNSMFEYLSLDSYTTNVFYAQNYIHSYFVIYKITLTRRLLQQVVSKAVKIIPHIIETCYIKYCITFLHLSETISSNYFIIQIRVMHMIYVVYNA